MELTIKLEDNLKGGIVTDNELIKRVLTVFEGVDKVYAEAELIKTIEVTRLEAEVEQKEAMIETLRKRADAAEERCKVLEEELKARDQPPPPHEDISADPAISKTLFVEPHVGSSAAQHQRIQEFNTRLQNIGNSIYGVSVQQKLLLCSSHLRTGNLERATYWAILAFEQATEVLSDQTTVIGQTQYWVARTAFQRGEFQLAYATFMEAREKGLVPGCEYSEGDEVDAWIIKARRKARQSGSAASAA